MVRSTTTDQEPGGGRTRRVRAVVLAAVAAASLLPTLAGAAAGDPGPSRALRELRAIVDGAGITADATSLVVATTPWGPSTAAASHDTVVFLGDSITHNAEAELQRAGTGAADDVEVVATSGIMTREQLDAAREVASGGPSVVVVNLGTNDAVCALENVVAEVPCRYAPFDLDDMRLDLRTVAEAFDPATCVVGVEPTFADAAGAEWRSMVAAGTADGVVSWGPLSRAFGDEVLSDSIGHLTDAGDRLYAEVVWDAVERTCTETTT